LPEPTKQTAQDRTAATDVHADCDTAREVTTIKPGVTVTWRMVPATELPVEQRLAWQRMLRLLFEPGAEHESREKSSRLFCDT